MAQHFQERLSFSEKAGYGFGDAAANFVFQTMLIFLLYAALDGVMTSSSSGAKKFST